MYLMYCRNTGNREELNASFPLDTCPQALVCMDLLELYDRIIPLVYTQQRVLSNNDFSKSKYIYICIYILWLSWNWKIQYITVYIYIYIYIYIHTVIYWIFQFQDNHINSHLSGHLWSVEKGRNYVCLSKGRTSGTVNEVNWRHAFLPYWR